MKSGFKAVCLSGAALFASQVFAETTLTYATYIPDTYALTKTDAWFMDEVERRTNGEIKFERYFGGSLISSAPDVMRGAGQGGIDAAGGSATSYNKSELPLHQMTIPFVSTNVAAVNHALMDMLANDAVTAEWDRMGLKPLYFTVYPENTVWTNEPLMTVEDYKGKKLRAVNLIADAVAALGATPVAIQWNEAVEGLSRGVVDGMTATPLDTAVSSGLHEVAKYATDGGQMGAYGTWSFAISKERFASFTPEQQKVFEEVARETVVKWLEGVDQELTNAAKVVCDTDVSVSLFPEAEVAKAREIGFPVVEAAYLKLASDAGVDGAAVLGQYVDLVRKYEAEIEYTPGLAIYMETCGKS